MKKSILISGLLCCVVKLSNGQLYILGNTTGKEVYVDGTMVGEPALYVNGYINNNGGELVNDVGEIELTGDWENYPGVAGSYESNGIERFSGSSTQTIKGTMNGTVGNINQFYSMRIAKTAAGQLVGMQTNTYVNAAGTIQFETNGIIRSDISSHGNNGSAYAYELYLQNSTVGSISGYATSGSNKYIEGRFRRQVNGAGSYYFPIGVQSTTLDGEEPFHIDFTTATNSNILSYVQPGTIDLLGTVMYCDVGTDPSPLAGTTILANPFSPADGILDQLTTNCQYSVEWKATASLVGPYGYTIVGEPGPVLRAECPFYVSTWLGELKWTAKDGVPNNASIASPAPFFTPGYMTCPNLFTIAGLTSFSVFRVHGIVDGTDVILPIEMLDFTGQVTTTGNLLKWTTHNETDNDFFTIQASADGSHFQSIGTMDGAGTTTDKRNYSFLDTDPLASSTYYRLQLTDFSGNHSYSNVIVLSRNSNESVLVSPVPTMSEITISYIADMDGSVDMNICAMDGKPVFNKSWQVVKGENKLVLDISSWSPAAYVLQINGGLQPLRARIIKL